MGAGTTSTPAGAGCETVRIDERDVGPAPLRLGGDCDAHAAGRAVADEAHEVERLPRAAGRDDDALAGERTGLAEELLTACEELLRLDHAARAMLALGELALLQAR